MNTMTHELEALWDKEYLVFFSFRGRIDFKLSTIEVQAYFDDPKQTKNHFLASDWMTEQSQKNSTVMRLPVPRGSSNAIVNLLSQSGDDDLEKVLVFSEDYVPNELKNKLGLNKKR
jgi:hypothetical protein